MTKRFVFSSESSVRLYVSPNKYFTSGDWVRLSWQYITSPSNYDWIGLYSPPQDDIYRINPVLHAPIKVQVVTCRSTFSHGHARYE